MVIDSTGWHPSGFRQSLNQPLKAGNARYGSINVFPGPRTSVTNNYYGNFDYGNYDYGNNNSSTNWMTALFGVGMGLNFFGKLASMILSRRESAVEEKPKDTAADDLKMYKQIAEANKHSLIGPDSEGNYVLLDSDSQIAKKGTFDEIKSYIETTFAKKDKLQSTGNPDPAGKKNEGPETPTNPGGKEPVNTVSDPDAVPKGTPKVGGAGNVRGTHGTRSTGGGGSDVTVKSEYVCTMPSGNKCYLQVMSDGSYKYLDKNKNEIDEDSFKKQTGLTGKQAFDKYGKKKEAGLTSTGKATENIEYNGKTYSEGMKYSSGNFIYKDQLATKHDNFDRDAIFVIGGQKYAIQGNLKEGRLTDEIDYGELTGHSNYNRSKSHQLLVQDSNGNYVFKATEQNENSSFTMKDASGKIIGTVCNREINGKNEVVLIGTDGKIIGTMNDIMNGKVKIDS